MEEFIIRELVIAGKKCHLCLRGDGGPLFVMAGFSMSIKEREKLLGEISAVTEEHFVLLIFEVKSWNDELSPWQTDGFAGQGRDTLAWILDKLLPAMEEEQIANRSVIPMGYSLAGLFALWSLYESKAFSGAISCSGSLWFPDYAEYAESHRLLKTADVYLSLGGKEEKTKNVQMAKVGVRTRMQEALLRKDPFCRQVILEWNRGGHFADADKRLAKGIAWMLGNYRKRRSRNDKE